MKKIVFLLLLPLLTLAQENNNLEWVQKFGGNFNETMDQIVADSNDDLIISGYFDGRLTLSSEYNYYTKGSTDIFIKKTDAKGNLKWAQRFGGSGADYLFDLVINDKGEIFGSGSFTNSCTIDQLTIYGSGTTSFIFKMSSDGEILWVKSIGSGINSWSEGNALAVDDNSNVYVTGRFTSTVDVDPSTSESLLTSKGDYDIFVAKYDNDGNFNWAFSEGSSNRDMGLCVVINSKKEIIISGSFKNTVDFDPSPTKLNLVSNGEDDVFIQKIDQNGKLISATSFGGTELAMPNKMILDSSDNMYIVGEFQNNLGFTGLSSTTFYNADGFTNTFTCKVSDDFKLEWSKYTNGQLGGTTSGRGIALDSEQNVYICGKFSNRVDFDPGTIPNSRLARNTESGFTQKFDNSGKTKWVNELTKFTGQAPALSITANSKNELYVVGRFRDEMDFLSGTSEYLVTANKNLDAFMLKYGYCIRTESIDTVHACGDYIWMDGETYNTDNNTATFVTTNANGCDSVIKLNLTIKRINAVDTVHACEAYTWIDGKKYSTNNDSATYKTTSPGGCDSIITLNLTITNVNTTVQKNRANLFAEALNAKFQWLDCDNGMKKIPNDTTAYHDNDLSMNGNFSVQVEQNGCIATSECVSISKETNWVQAMTSIFDYTITAIALDEKEDVISGGLERSYNSKNSIFIQKHDPNGTFLWKKSFENKERNHRVTKIATDRDNNIYVLGEFDSYLGFNPGPNDTTLYSEGREDIFVLKLNPDGEYLWVKQFGNDELLNDPISIEVDKYGDVFILAAYTGYIRFYESTPVFIYETHTAPSNSTLLIKLNTNGKYKWSAISEGNLPTSFALNTANNEISVLTKNSTKKDLRILKYNTSSGKQTWTKSITDGEDEAGDIIVDKENNMYVTAYMDHYGESTSNGYMTNYPTFAIQKYNATGDLLWDNRVKVDLQYGFINSFRKGENMELDQNDHLMVSYHFRGMANFNPNGDSIVINSAGGQDIALQKFDRNGHLINVKTIEGTGDETCHSFTLDQDGNVYLGGQYTDNIKLTGKDGTVSYDATEEDGFIQKLLYCSEHVIIDSLASCSSYTWKNDSTYNSNTKIGSFHKKGENSCDTIYYLDLTIGQLDTSILNAGESLISNQKNVEYQWLDCTSNYAPIEGANSVAYTPTTAGKYAVQIKSGDCIDTTSCQTFMTVGLSDKSPIKSSIHPNPNDGNFTINLDKNYQSVIVQIFTIEGREVFFNSFQNEKSLSIKLSEEPGLYHVLIRTDGSSISRKIVIK